MPSLCERSHRSSHNLGSSVQFGLAERLKSPVLRMKICMARENEKKCLQSKFVGAVLWLRFIVAWGELSSHLYSSPTTQERCGIDSATVMPEKPLHDPRFAPNFAGAHVPKCHDPGPKWPFFCNGAATSQSVSQFYSIAKQEIMR